MECQKVVKGASTCRVEHEHHRKHNQSEDQRASHLRHRVQGVPVDAEAGNHGSEHAESCWRVTAKQSAIAVADRTEHVANVTTETVENQHSQVAHLGAGKHVAEEQQVCSREHVLFKTVRDEKRTQRSPQLVVIPHFVRIHDLKFVQEPWHWSKEPTKRQRVSLYSNCDKFRCVHGRIEHPDQEREAGCGAIRAEVLSPKIPVVVVSRRLPSLRACSDAHATQDAEHLRSFDVLFIGHWGASDVVVGVVAVVHPLVLIIVVRKGVDV